MITHIFRYLPFVVFGFFTHIAEAATCAPDQYELIAPIGTLSGCVNLAGYLRGIFETTIGIGGVLAVIMIVICGIKLMATGSVSGKNEAKECITNAIFGVLLAIGSWLILNTINPILLKAEPSALGAPVQTAAAPHIALIEPNPTRQGCYFKYKDNITGDVKFSRSDTCTACESQRNQFQADVATYQIQSLCYDPTKNATPPTSSAPPVSVGIRCPYTGTNLCEGKYRQCTNPKCAQFAGMAAANAGGVATANLLKAIIMEESSCGINLVGDGGKSCGPIQIQPATANKFLAACGLSAPVTCGWLTRAENFNGAICLASQYIQSLAAPCGSQIQNIAAGYNGGPGACSASVSCGGETSCSGGGVKKWECLYDDAAHQQCNAGYNSAKNYATEVNYCTTHPGY